MSGFYNLNIEIKTFKVELQLGYSIMLVSGVLYSDLKLLQIINLKFNLEKRT